MKKDNSNRVYRGGGWGNDACLVWVAGRYWNFPSRRYDDIGFRLSRTVNHLDQLVEVGPVRVRGGTPSATVGGRSASITSHRFDNLGFRLSRIVNNRYGFIPSGRYRNFPSRRYDVKKGGNHE